MGKNNKLSNPKSHLQIRNAGLQDVSAIADLRPETLVMARNSGSVQNLRDRRHDLYQLHWKGK